MKASLRVEAIGDDLVGEMRITRIKLRGMVGAALAHQVIDRIPQRAWCAEIVGRDPRYGLDRRFLRGKKDYRFANSTGSRGVYLYFILESGRIYEVSSPQSWHRDDRYFCHVTDAGDIERITREDVDAWLLKNGASRSASAS